MTPAQIEGDLEHGLTIGGKVCKHFVLQEVDTGAMFDAEEMVPPERQMAYRGALLTFQLKQLGEYKGPFDLVMLRKLKPADFDTLVEAQNRLGKEVGKPGED